eukprot:gene12291-25847_t
MSTRSHQNVLINSSGLFVFDGEPLSRSNPKLKSNFEKNLHCGTCGKLLDGIFCVSCPQLSSSTTHNIADVLTDWRTVKNQLSNLDSNFSNTSTTYGNLHNTNKTLISPSKMVSISPKIDHSDTFDNNQNYTNTIGFLNPNKNRIEFVPDVHEFPTIHDRKLDKTHSKIRIYDKNSLAHTLNPSKSNTSSTSTSDVMEARYIGFLKVGPRPKDGSYAPPKDLSDKMKKRSLWLFQCTQFFTIFVPYYSRVPPLLRLHPALVPLPFRLRLAVVLCRIS